jgi:hypothetical protein
VLTQSGNSFYHNSTVPEHVANVQRYPELGYSSMRPLILWHCANGENVDTHCRILNTVAILDSHSGPRSALSFWYWTTRSGANRAAVEALSDINL